jgi:hypothetical protein
MPSTVSSGPTPSDCSGWRAERGCGARGPHRCPVPWRRDPPANAGRFS